MNGFRSFRITAYQEALAEGGRCLRVSKAKVA
jgi:hypothetical protein